MVGLRKGENVLMLRLMVHYGSFSAAVEVGPGGATELREFASATDFCAGLWDADGGGALPGVSQ